LCIASPTPVFDSLISQHSSYTPPPSSYTSSPFTSLVLPSSTKSILDLSNAITVSFTSLLETSLEKKILSKRFQYISDLFYYSILSYLT